MMPEPHVLWSSDSLASGLALAPQPFPCSIVGPRSSLWLYEPSPVFFRLLSTLSLKSSALSELLSNFYPHFLIYFFLSFQSFSLLLPCCAISLFLQLLYCC
jgi:hypothetical protein